MPGPLSSTSNWNQCVAPDGVLAPSSQPRMPPTLGTPLRAGGCVDPFGGSRSGGDDGFTAVTSVFGVDGTAAPVPSLTFSLPPSLVFVSDLLPASDGCGSECVELCVVPGCEKLTLDNRVP